MPELQTTAAPRLEARFAPATWNAEARTVELSWGRGVEVERVDWRTDQRFIERLTMDVAAVDMTRLNNGAPLLDTHARYSLSSVIGTVERAWIERGEGRAIVRFSQRDEVQPIIRDVRDGILRNVSVGYAVDEWKESRDELGRLVRTAVRWTPHEISLVPVPADASAQVRAAGGASASLPGDHHHEEGRMADTTQAPENLAHSNEPAVKPVDEAAIRAAAAESERARIASLEAPTALARDAGMNETTLAALRGMAIEQGWNAEQLQARLFEAVAKTRAKDARAEAELARTPGFQPRPVDRFGNAEVTRDEGDTLRKRVGLALVSAIRDQPPAATPEEAREFRGAGISGMLREMAMHAGDRSAARMSNSQLWERILQTRQGGPHSTSDFPIILKDAANVALQQEFGEFPRTFEVWTQSTEVADFKQITSAQIGTMPDLVKIAQGQPVPYRPVSEEGEVYKVDTYAAIVALTREMIINDQLGAFGRTIRSAAEAGFRALNDLVYLQLTANANMADGNRLFSAAHSNVGTGAAGTIFHYLAAPDRPTVEVAYLRGRRAPEVAEEEQFNVLGVSYRVVFDFGAKAVSWRGLTRERAAVNPDGSTVAALEALLLTMREVGGSLMRPPSRLVLLVPPSEHMAARRLATAVTPDSVANVNIYGGLTVVVEPRLGNATQV